NAAASTLRYVNLHIPGCGFADYLRALRDGRTLVYDQEDPPADGVRPASEAVIGPPPTLGAEPVAVGVIGAGRPGAGGLFVLEGALTAAGVEAGPGSWITLDDSTVVN